MTTVSAYALKQSRRRDFWKRYGLAFVFLAPYLFFFLLFCIYPLLYGIVMSFMRFSIRDYSQNEWRGLRNFYTILFNTQSGFHIDFWYAMRNTALFAIVIVPLAIIFPLVIAILINTKPKGYKIFRAIVYLPSVLPVAASGAIFAAMFAKDYGYINQWFGVAVDWFGNPTLAWTVILLLCLWGGWGGNFLILSAGLKNLDKSLYEAASVDGCTGIKRTFAITLPAIKQQLVLCVFTTIIGYFGLYGQIYVLTGGGPSVMVNGVNHDSTTSIMFYIQTLLGGEESRSVYGMVSAMGLLLGIFVGIITGLQLWLTRDKKSGTKISADYNAYMLEKKTAPKAPVSGTNTGAEEGGGL